MDKEHSMQAKIILESMVDQEIVKVIKNITVSESVFEEIVDFCLNNKNVIMEVISDNEIHIGINNQQDTNEEYFIYLDDLRESGVTNMFGATPYLIRTFPELSEVDASNVLKSWMKTFSERHKDWINLN